MQSERAMKIEALLCLKKEMCTDLILDYVMQLMIQTEVFTEEEETAILNAGHELGSAEDLVVRDRVLWIQSELFIDWNKEVVENFELGVPVMVTTRDRGYFPSQYKTVIESWPTPLTMTMDSHRRKVDNC